MRRPTRAWLAALGVGVVALVLAIGALYVARGWSTEDGGSYAPARTLTATSLEPRSVLFGDPVDATARLVVDVREVDPSSLVLDPSFKPFQAFASSRRIVSGLGHAAEVSFVFRLQCVTGACIQAMEQEQKGGSLRTVPIVLPAATARARRRDGSVISIPLTWPTLVVHSRLTADDVALGEPVAPSFVAVKVSYSRSPERLAWVLIAFAVALLLVAGALIASVVRKQRRERRLVLPAHLGPVERSLALARHAVDTGDVPGGRKALERLSTELERGGRIDLAQTAGRIAWSPPGPTVSEIDDLARLVGSSANGR